VPRERLCAIVAADHRRYWQPTLWALPASNVIVQPRNCGTAIGILLAVLRILERDPLARILFLPADHYVRDENALAGSLRGAANLVTRNDSALALVGIEPEEADPELGYIVPGTVSADGARNVARFVEKPDATVARSLLKKGALWNSFIFAGSGPALLGMLRKRMPEIVEQIETALARDALEGVQSNALAELYSELPSIDFSRVVLQDAGSELRVISAPACGWSDLGTPKRVLDTLKRIEHDRMDRVTPQVGRPSLITTPAFMNLAAQRARLGFAG
jgi:mannose-1-phosphate guanylyltransferase